MNRKETNENFIMAIAHTWKLDNCKKWVEFKHI